MTDDIPSDKLQEASYSMLTQHTSTLDLGKKLSFQTASFSCQPVCCDAPAAFVITHDVVWKNKLAQHLLVITTGMHGSVMQLNPGKASLTGKVGKPRSRSTSWTVDQRHLHADFSQGFISKAVQSLEVTFIQRGGTLHTSGYTSQLRAWVNVMLLLLQLHNVMPSSAGAAAVDSVRPVKFHSNSSQILPQNKQITHEKLLLKLLLEQVSKPS